MKSRQTGWGNPRAAREVRSEWFRADSAFRQLRGQHPGKGEPAAGSHRQIRLQHPSELGNRLVVEHDRVELRNVKPRLFEAKGRREPGETLVILAPAEAFLLRGGDDATVRQQRGCRIMVIR